MNPKTIFNIFSTAKHLEIQCYLQWYWRQIWTKDTCN